VEDSSTSYEDKYPTRSCIADVGEIRSRAEQTMALALDLSSECRYPFKHVTEHHYQELGLPRGPRHVTLWDMVIEVIVGDLEDWLEQGGRCDAVIEEDGRRCDGTA